MDTVIWPFNIGMKEKKKNSRIRYTLSASPSLYRVAWSKLFISLRCSFFVKQADNTCFTMRSINK